MTQVPYSSESDVNLNSDSSDEESDNEPLPSPVRRSKRNKASNIDKSTPPPTLRN